MELNYTERNITKGEERKNTSLLRSEGKEYVMRDGDVVEFLFNV